MAQIEPSDKGGKKKKGAQKKIAIHVDFTPMVDMNMLLITFFMLCTTMIKSQTVQIALPAAPDPNKTDKSENNQASKEQVMTLILDTQYDEKGLPKQDAEGNTIHDVYYYYGDAADFIHNPDDVFRPKTLYHESYVANNNGEIQGIRKVIRQKNKGVMDKYDALKDEFARGAIEEEEFNAKTREITADSLNKPAIVIIKAMPNATYENVINAFDELNLNKVTRYSVEDFNARDDSMLRIYEAQHGVQINRNSVRDNANK